LLAESGKELGKRRKCDAGGEEERRRGSSAIIFRVFL
jgi:hypothetical protein